MSEENVDLFRRAVEAFNAWDLETLTNLTTDDFEFIPYLASAVETTSYRGAEGLRRYRDESTAAWEKIEVRLGTVRDLGDRLIAFGELRGHGRRSGVEIRAAVTWIAGFREGKMSALRSYETASEALEAAGLSP